MLKAHFCLVISVTWIVKYVMKYFWYGLWGPSGSFYCLFSVGSFLTLLFAIGNVAIWEGTMTPSPPWIRPCL